MEFSKKLYISPKLQKKKTKLKWSFKYGKKPKDIYVISLSKTNDLMEIYSSNQMRQKFYPTNNMFVIGLADSYDASLQLVQDILLDTMKHGYHFDLKSYIRKMNEK